MLLTVTLLDVTNVRQKSYVKTHQVQVCIFYL